MITTVRYRVGDLVPYVNWLYFFYAWGMSPRFSSVSAVHDCAACRQAWVNNFPEADRAQAREAERLYCDAVKTLREMSERERVGGVFGLFPAWSEGDDIMLQTDGVNVRMPLLRQQHTGKADEPCLCLADFVSPHRPTEDAAIATLPVGNVVGLFATAVPGEMEQLHAADDYRHMLVQTLCDRLAEAAAERLHEEVRRHYWGYAPEEQLTAAELFGEKYQGRRPAVGYPSLPDQSLMFLFEQVLPLREIGVTLTESGMMRPHAAVAGLMLGHPATHHFAVGRIDEAQLADYAARRNVPADTLRRFLAANLRH